MSETDRLQEAVLDAMLQAAKHRRDTGKDEGRIPVMVSTSVPLGLVPAYLQMLRSWDVEHDMDSAIGILGGIPRDELLAIFRNIVPPFPFTEERTV